MASIIEELIIVLKEECELYETIIPIAKEKTKVIVKNDLQALQHITAEEQEAVDKVNVLEKKREKVIQNVATVISKDPLTITVSKIIEMLHKQPTEQEELRKVHANLKTAVDELVGINRHNANLIRESLEMIEFDLNLIKGTRMSPGSNNYTKGAAAVDHNNSSKTGMFDAKQ